MIPLAFLLALTALLFQGLYLPHISILAFAPFLALISLSLPLSTTLWLSFLSGVLIDLFSEDPMGLHALNYVLTTALLYRLRSLFSAERPFHLSLFTALISLFSTLFQLILLFLFDRRVPFNGKWIFADLFAMPLVDALYAFVWFAVPLAVGGKITKMWTLFWLKKNNRSQTSH